MIYAIASPDIGGAKRANSWAKHFDSGLIICHKTRIRANEVADMKVIGDVEGKNIIVVDDMIDTAGTICKAADMLGRQRCCQRTRCRNPRRTFR